MKRLIAAMLFIAVTPLLSRADESWVDQRIFLKRDAKCQVDARRAEKEFNVAKIDFPLKVFKAQSGWLWIAPGWVSESDALTADQALEYYTERVRQQPGDSVAWNIRAMVLRQQGQFDRGIEDSTQAIQLDPKNALAYYNRGMNWEEKGDWAKAIPDFTTAIELDPKNAMHRLERARSYLQSRQFDTSLEDLNEAILLDPENLGARLMRGDILGLKREYDKAIEDFTEVIRIAPKLPGGYFGRGSELLSKRENLQGIADLTKSIQFGAAKYYPEVYFFRGKAWRDEGEAEKAIADFTEAIRRIPKVAAPYNQLARIQATWPDEHYRNGPEAIRNATTACELTDWKDVECLDTLSAAYAEASDIPAAIQWIEKAIALAPTEARKQQGGDRLELYKSGKPYHEPPKQ